MLDGGLDRRRNRARAAAANRQMRTAEARSDRPKRSWTLWETARREKRADVKEAAPARRSIVSQARPARREISLFKGVATRSWPVIRRLTASR